MRGRRSAAPPPAPAGVGPPLPGLRRPPEERARRGRRAEPGLRGGGGGAPGDPPPGRAAVGRGRAAPAPRVALLVLGHHRVARAGSLRSRPLPWLTLLLGRLLGRGHRRLLPGLPGLLLALTASADLLHQASSREWIPLRTQMDTPPAGLMRSSSPGGGRARGRRSCASARPA